MFVRKYSYCEQAQPDGVTGGHPATGTGTDDGDTPPAATGDTPPAAGLTAAAAAALKDDAPPPGDPAPDGRPADIPEQFWKPGEDGQPGTINHEALVKSWKDTRAELKTLKGSEGAEVPENPEDYTFTPPEESDVNYKDLAADDPGMAAAKIAAKEAGLSPAAFQKFMQTFFENAKDAIPEPFDEAAELAIVGKNGAAVNEANARWLKGLIDRGTLSEDEYNEAMLIGATGYGVRFLAKIRAEATGEKSIPLDTVESAGAMPSKEELYKMQADSRYASDPAYRADVDRKFEQVYGTGAAGSSEQNMGVSHMNAPPANIARADEILRKQQGG